MRRRFFEILTAIMLIITLTMVNFIFLCANVVTYAAEVINADKSTSHKNVEVMAYFKDAQGNKVNKIEEEMSKEDMKIYFQITVKQEGYYNGSIELKDANFKFKKEVTSEDIKSIEENKIDLNQIKVGDTKEIEVGIDVIKDEDYDLSLISKESKIEIGGIYRDSTEKDIIIEAEKEVELGLKSPYNSENGRKVNAQVITNKVVEYRGEDKRVIQVRVEGELDGNKYPVKKSIYKVQVPELSENTPEEVKVYGEGKQVTNGLNITENEWTYDKDTKQVNIEITNQIVDNKVKWIKEGKDSFVVTFIYGKDKVVNGEKLKIEIEDELYDQNDTKLNAIVEQEISEDEKDGVIETKIEEKENNIYKGKLYAGIDREITHTSVINVNLDNVAKVIQVQETGLKIKNAINEKNIVSEYKMSILNKDEIDKILGQNGSIEILNGNTKEVISTINKTTDVNENGDIQIVYPNGVNTIIIKVINPEGIGCLNVQSTIDVKNIAHKDVEDAIELNSKLTGSYTTLTKENKIDERDTKINLQETNTEATLDINRKDFSTMTTNKSVEFTVVLKSQKENNDLYKNPKVSIQIPDKIESIKVNSINLLYEDELKIKSAVLNGKTIEIQFEGEQTKYKGEAIEGATITINADLDINKREVSSQEQVKLTYTNDNAKSYADGELQGESSQDINVVSYAGIVTTNEIAEYGIEQINNEGETTGKLGINQGLKSTTINKTIINNKEDVIKDVKILGIFPTKEAVANSNTIEMSVSSQIKIENVDVNRYQIYYTTNANADEDLEKLENGWSLSFDDGKSVKKYLVVLDRLDKQEDVGLSYDIEIPAGLEYNEKAEEGYEIYYTNATEVKENLQLNTLTLTTGQGPALESSLKAYVGADEATEAKEGEIIKFVATVTNTGAEDVQNVTVVGQVPDGTTYVTINKVPDATNNNVGELVLKDESKKEVELSIDEIKVGETKQVEYLVIVNDNITENKEISNVLNVKYLGIEKQSNILKCNLKSGDLQVLLKPGTNYDKLEVGYTYTYGIDIYNKSNDEKNNVQVEFCYDDDVIKCTEIRYEVNDGNDDKVKRQEGSNIITIDSIAANKKQSVYIDFTLSAKNVSNVNICAKANVENKLYNSNVYNMNVTKFDITVKNTSDKDGDYIKTEDVVEYKIKVNNNESNEIKNMGIELKFSNYLYCVELYKNDNELVEYSQVLNSENEREIRLSEDINANEIIEYTAKLEVLPNKGNTDNNVTIFTNVFIKVNGVQVAKANEVMHIVEKENADNSNNPDNPDNPDNPNKPDTPDNPNNPDTPSDNKTKRYISGVAWLDENGDGKRQDDEKKLDGITVRALNVETNKFQENENNEIINEKTNSEGFYSLELPQGNYIIIFEYDTENYKLTYYKKEGATDKENSNVIDKFITANGQENKVAATEELKISSSNIGNINMGLQKKKKFDLKLEKFISIVTVQNDKGTITNVYNNATSAKTEIAAKQINGSVVTVEYTIKVTNVGELDGYARKIVDYLASDYKFNSQLNPDWYQSGENIYNSSLANEKISPGESKELKLIVSKNMTNENAGLINNTAEIAESYNEEGVSDINSTEGNRVNGENDMGSADLIISIKTGEMIENFLISICTGLFIVLIVYFLIIIYKKRRYEIKNRR